jgi:hypothetical protein
VIAPGAYDAGDLPVLVYAEGQQLRQATGHGLTLTVDGREALLGEVDRSESAVWTTNTYAVAWIGWSLNRELTRQVPLKEQSA